MSAKTLSQKEALPTEIKVEDKPHLHLCMGCLAGSREVKRIKPKHYEFHNSLIDFFYHIKNPDESFFFCFECCRRFDNFEKFLNEVARAQTILNKAEQVEKVPCLSNLTIVTKTECDYNLIENEGNKSSLERFEEIEIIKTETQDLIGDCNDYKDFVDDCKDECSSNFSVGNSLEYKYEEAKAANNFCVNGKNINSLKGKDVYKMDDNLHPYILKKKKNYCQEDKEIKIISVKKEKRVLKRKKNNSAENTLTEPTTSKTKKKRIPKKEVVQVNKKESRPSEFICDHCGQIKRTKGSIESHIRTRHSPPQTCNICMRKLRNIHRLKEHMLYAHKTDPPELTYCIMCDKHYRNRRVLHAHYHSVHGPRSTEKKKFPCDSCGKQFITKFHLDLHKQAVHHNIRIHRCPLCPKTYKYPQGLACHLQGHKNEPKKKDKICHLCGRGFHTNRELQVHVYTHTDERPNKCNQCSYACNQKYPLRRHILKVHGGEKKTEESEEKSEDHFK